VRGFVGASLSYVGDRIGEFFGSPQRQVFPAYAKTDMHAGVRYGFWTGNIFVNNLADKRAALQGGLGTFIPGGFNYIQPRTVGLSLTKTFQ
jgi:hypothetical protein